MHWEQVINPTMERQWSEVLLTMLAAGVPLPIGTVLRRLMYPSLFKQFGKSVLIQPAVEWWGCEQISLGDRFTIHRDSSIRTLTSNSKICFGDDVFIDLGVDILLHGDDQGCIELGDKSYLGPYVCLSGANIKIGHSCLIASHTTLIAYSFEDPGETMPILDQPLTYRGITIGDDCWIGSGVKILDGVTIGDGCIIGAGAYVDCDIPPYSVAVGVPARVVQHRPKPEPQLASGLMVRPV